MSEFQPQVTLKGVRTIHVSMLLGVLLFMLMTLRIVEEMTPFHFDLEDPMILTLVFLTLAVIPASIFVPKYYLSKNPPKEGLQAKLTLFQTLMIIKLAPWEGVALFGNVIFMISGNPMPLAVTILALLVMTTFFPSIESIQKTANLSQDEVEVLKKK